MIDPEPALLEAARELGFETWSLSHLDTDDGPAADHAERSVVSVLLVETARVNGIEHILYFGDRPALHHAVEDALVTLSPNRAASLHTLQDPAAMRRTLNQAGVSVVNAVRVGSLNIARTWLESLRHPAVVKTGPDHRVDIVWNRSALDAWVAGRPALPCVIEEFLEGPQLVVDTFTHAGMHHVLGMVGAGTTLTGGRFVHPVQPAEVNAAAVRATVRALLDLTGLEGGRVRTRVVLTSQGPRIASARASPVPGPAARLMAAATGQDPWAEVLAVLGGRVHPRRPGPHRRLSTSEDMGRD
ncbi:hypothetical protein [Streptomyces rubiginosohelvolus]|uniref:hypothetical protein n=1 Tax=Streptomyces rubiginosohelvolus TaxID=67362 RepID=UPI0036D1A9C3